MGAEFKLIDEGHLFASEQLLVTGDENSVYYDNPKPRKLWEYSSHASKPIAKPNILESKCMLSLFGKTS